MFEHKCLYFIFRKIRQSNQPCRPKHLHFPLCQQEIRFLEEVIRENITGHARELCTALLTNEIGGPGSYLSLRAGVPAKRRPVLELLVHASAVFYSGNSLLSPLYNIASKPQNVTVRASS